MDFFKFKENLAEAVSQSQVQKVRGILGRATKDGMKGNSEFGTWKFKDGSYIEVDDNKARIDYMGKDGKLITSYTTVNQMKSALYQSGLLESTELAEGDVELKVGSSCAYRGTKCKVLKALGGNKYEIEYKGKPLNVKMQGMTLVAESVELEETLTVADGMAKWIEDFKGSDAPQFDGKSDKDRRDMAIAAYMSAKAKK